MELFWQTIADYNTMTWPVQALIVLAAVVLTARLYLRPTLRVKTAMKCFLAFLNAWIAVAYYLVSCDARAYSGVMAFFWGVMAAVWIYDAVVGYTTFERTYKHDKFAFALYLMPFLYPLISHLRGLDFPMTTSASDAADGRHSRIIPAIYQLCFNHFSKFAFAGNHCGYIKTGKFNLSRLFLAVISLKAPVI